MLYNCNNVDTSTSSSKFFLPSKFSFTSSMIKLAYTFFGWNFFTRLQAAFMVPPVARRSS